MDFESCEQRQKTGVFRFVSYKSNRYKFENHSYLKIFLGSKKQENFSLEVPMI